MHYSNIDRLQQVIWIVLVLIFVDGYVAGLSFGVKISSPFIIVPIACTAVFVFLLRKYVVEIVHRIEGMKGEYKVRASRTR